MKEAFDIIVVVPLEEELHEFIKEFPLSRDRSSPTQIIYEFDTGF